jgi:hypothetical protein
MAKVITFDMHRDGELNCPMVIDYPDGEIGLATLVRGREDVGGEQVTASGKSCILFDYPLANPVTLESETSGTLKDLLRCIYQGYTEIYAAETDPGFIPGFLNRARSTGPYGTSGHLIDDLWVEGIIQTGPSSFELHMGS